MNEDKLWETLGRIEGKQDSHIKVIYEVKRDVKDGFKFMNGRVRLLEGWRNRFLGGAALVGILIAGAKVFL